MIYKLFYSKEPELHTFYVDFENNKFYKCWNLSYDQHFLNCVEVFGKLKASIHVPKLYDAYVTKSRYVLEMEYIFSFPIWGYGKMYLPWKDITYSVEQKESIKRQFEEICVEIEKAGLVVDGKVQFEFTQNNLIYDSEKDNLLVYDFALGNDNFEVVRNIIREHIDGLPVGDRANTILSKEQVLKYHIYPDVIKRGLFDEAYNEGENLIKDMEEAGPRFVYQSVDINGKLVVGQREVVAERAEVIFIPQDELVGKVVVDIGCNIGAWLVYIIERGANKAIGIESCPKASLLGKRYIDYLTKIYSLYERINIIQGDAVTFDYTSYNPDIIFYFSCWRHFGSPEFHKKLGSCGTKIIYFEGHAHEGEKELMEKLLPEFGSEWQWTYLGLLPNGIGAPELMRPVFKGVKNA